VTASRRRTAVSARRGASALAAVVTLSTWCAVGASSASSHTVLATARGCAPSFAVRPSALILSCADDNEYFGSVHWSSWSASRAVGTGLYMRNPCTPSCVDSSVKPVVRIALVASSPIASHGTTFFTRLAVTNLVSKVTVTLKWLWAATPALTGDWSWSRHGWLH
jgi:hypothetical protein